MYNPVDYRNKVEQVKKQRSLIILLITSLVIMTFVYIMQVRATIDSDTRAMDTSDMMVRKCDSLQHEINQLRGEQWFVDNDMER